MRRRLGDGAVVEQVGDLARQRTGEPLASLVRQRSAERPDHDLRLFPRTPRPHTSAPPDVLVELGGAAGTSGQGQAVAQAAREVNRQRGAIGFGEPSADPGDHRVDTTLCRIMIGHPEVSHVAEQAIGRYRCHHPRSTCIARAFRDEEIAQLMLGRDAVGATLAERARGGSLGRAVAESLALALP